MKGPDSRILGLARPADLLAQVRARRSRAP
jgi:hypothetical protein